MAEAAIGAGASLLGGVLQNRGASQAQDAQTQAAQAAIAEQRRQYDQSRQDQSPFMQFGQGQLGALGALNGGDMSGWENSPDRIAAMKGGLYALDHSAAARGRMNSGGFQADLQNAGQQNAAQYLGNYRNSLQWGANLGQNAASGLGQLGANSANQIGSAFGNIGQAGAQGAYDRTNAWGGAINGLSQGLSSYFGSR